MTRGGICSAQIWVSALVISLIVSGCSANRYATTNAQYKRQLKELAKQLQAPLPYVTPRLIATYDTITGLTSVSEIPQTKREMEPVASIHFNLRKPNYVILHHTAQDSVEQTLRTFTVPHSQVSSHYVIGRNGEIYQMLNDYVRAWHAGAGKWGSITDLNSVSLGVELDNNGKEPFTEPQIYSLLNLLDTLKRRYNIPPANFIGHSDIAPTRKVDPSSYFPWKRLAERDFGLWPDDVLMTPPDNFNPVDALRIIGYDTTNLESAIKAFKLHYVQYDVSGELTDYDLRILYNLYSKR